MASYGYPFALIMSDGIWNSVQTAMRATISEFLENGTPSLEQRTNTSCMDTLGVIRLTLVYGTDYGLTNFLARALACGCFDWEIDWHGVGDSSFTAEMYDTLSLSVDTSILMK